MSRRLSPFNPTGTLRVPAVTPALFGTVHTYGGLAWGLTLGRSAAAPASAEFPAGLHWRLKTGISGAWDRRPPGEGDPERYRNKFVTGGL
jgi:hypothetical protein